MKFDLLGVAMTASGATKIAFRTRHRKSWYSTWNTWDEPRTAVQKANGSWVYVKKVGRGELYGESCEPEIAAQLTAWDTEWWIPKPTLASTKPKRPKRVRGRSKKAKAEPVPDPNYWTIVEIYNPHAEQTATPEPDDLPF